MVPILKMRRFSCLLRLSLPPEMGEMAQTFILAYFLSHDYLSYINSFGFLFILMLETLDYTIRIGSTPTFLYFNLYFYSAYAAHYV